MSYALLFAGQGSQHADMLPWLNAQASCPSSILEMEKRLGPSWREDLKDPKERSVNQFAQTLITGTSLAAWEVLQPLLPESPAVVAGYSVGEMAAYACAGALSIPQALELTAWRAEAMDCAGAGQLTGLLSVSGYSVDQVQAAFPQLQCAILIDQDHAIYGGVTHDLDAAERQLGQAGAICNRLAIQVASHTRFLASASSRFQSMLEVEPFLPPNFPIVVNANAQAARRPDALKQALSGQISSMVDWASCMDAVAERGIQCVLEIGPGRALSTMWNRHNAAVPARSLEDFHDPAGAARWIQRQLD